MAVDMFLKIDGIKGESLDKSHKDEIDVLSFGWGEANPREGGSGKVDMQDFSFVSYIDLASADLFQNAASGKAIPSATLTVRKAGEKPHEYLTIKFTDVVISSYQFGGSGAEDRSTNQFALWYAVIHYTYRQQKPDGSPGTTVTRGWDRVKNQPAS